MDLVMSNSTLAELEAAFEFAKAEMDFIHRKMGEADRNMAPFAKLMALGDAYEAAKERRRLAFNAWMTAEMES